MMQLKRIFLRRSLEELQALSAEISRAKDRSEEKCVEMARPILPCNCKAYEGWRRFCGECLAILNDR
jgi:hypothetical protein